MDFRILRKKTFSDEFVRFELEEFYELKELINKLQLPLLSRLTEFYAHNVSYKRFESDDLYNEINSILSELKNPGVIKLLNNLQDLIKQAKEENKPIEVLTE